MNSATYRIRRATLDDMPQLTTLWQSMNFVMDDMARRITEFQVAEASDGTLLGTVGLQMTEKQGRIHSEAFRDFSVAEEIRPLLWERLTTLATNHGLLRFWTQEQAPFWGRQGLVAPDADTLGKLPTAWRDLPGTWLTRKLREDVETLLSADKEFAAFKEAERLRTQQTFQRAKILKTLAILVAFLVLILVFLGIFFLLQRNPQAFKK